MQPQIEKGIKVPDIANGWCALFRKMKIGESVLLDGDKGSVRNAANVTFGAGNYVSRSENGKLRIWRTK